jgi:hypothetical protein
MRGTVCSWEGHLAGLFPIVYGDGRSMDGDRGLDFGLREGVLSVERTFSL